MAQSFPSDTVGSMVAVRVRSKPPMELHPMLKKPYRGWPASIGLAAVMVAVILGVAVGINLVLPGRVMHWDIVAVMGVVGLIGLSLGTRFRVL